MEPEDRRESMPAADDVDPTQEALGPDERELLAAFDRLAPQGTLRWGFDDAMRRLSLVESSAADIPWRGLPDDLWERGRSALIGKRFVGDVAGVLAELMAADARAAADAAVGNRTTAAWDALRFLAARVDELERRVDPVASLAVAPGAWAPIPDVTAWVDQVATWFRAPGTDNLSGAASAIVVGESGDGALLEPLMSAGHRARGVEPHGALAWRSFGTDGSIAVRTRDVVIGDVADTLRSTGSGTLAGVVLAGCIDRVDLPSKVTLVKDAVRTVAPGGTVALLVTDQHGWDAAIEPVARDLASGRPLHPETCKFLLGRAGVKDATWHAPVAGVVHAVVGTVGS